MGKSDLKEDESILQPDGLIAYIYLTNDNSKKTKIVHRILGCCKKESYVPNMARAMDVKSWKRHGSFCK